MPRATGAARPSLSGAVCSSWPLTGVDVAAPVRCMWSLSAPAAPSTCAHDRPCCQYASMASNSLPFVSGARNQTKTIWTTASCCRTASPTATIKATRNPPWKSSCVDACVASSSRVLIRPISSSVPVGTTRRMTAVASSHRPLLASQRGVSCRKNMPMPRAAAGMIATANMGGQPRPASLKPRSARYATRIPTVIINLPARCVRYRLRWQPSISSSTPRRVRPQPGRAPGPGPPPAPAPGLRAGHLTAQECDPPDGNRRAPPRPPP